MTTGSFSARGGTPRVLAMFCWALFTAACGGGGGKAQPGDDLALEGTHIAPADLATGVALDVVPTFYSDVSVIDCATVSSISFTLAMDPGPAVTGTVACSDHSVTFTPAAPLAPATPYVVYVSSMRNVPGKYLAKNTAWRFTTAAAPPPGSFWIQVNVSGLTGAGLVLRDNGGDDLAVSHDGAFTFATSVASGASYDVTVRTQPAAQRCTVTGGAGTVPGHDVTGVAVTCAARSTTPAAFMYLSNYGSISTVHSISPFWIDEAGGIHALPQGPIDTVSGGPLVADPAGKNLYLCAGTNGIVRFSIGADGTLTERETTTLSHWPWVTSVVFHPGGQHAYVTAYAGTGNSTEVVLHDVAPDGVLTAANVDRLDFGDSLGVVVDPAGKNAYVKGGYTDPTQTPPYSTRYTHYTIQADGNWAPHYGETFYIAGYNNAPIVEPLGRAAYILGPNVHEWYTIDANGAFISQGPFPLGGGGATKQAALTFHPSGRYAWAARVHDSTIEEYDVGASGALTSRDTFWPGAQQVAGYVFDATGRFAYTGEIPMGYGVKMVAQYDVDGAGRLVPMVNGLAGGNGLEGYGTAPVIVPVP